MLKPALLASKRSNQTALRIAFTTLAIAALTTTLHAQAGAAGPRSGKPIANINFGTNGSNPDRRDLKERILQGKVQDPSGKPLKGAIVYLKDKHDDSLKSMAAGEDGTYRFDQLSVSRDYEVWAQLDKKKGVLKQISSFDDRPDIMLNLKVEPSK